MSIERTQNTKPLGEQPNDASERVCNSGQSLLSRMWRNLRECSVPAGSVPLWTEEGDVQPPEHKYPEELRIVVPPNISPERLVIEGCWGDSLPEVKLMRSEQLMTMQLHDESMCSKALDDLIYGVLGGGQGRF